MRRSLLQALCLLLLATKCELKQLGRRSRPATCRQYVASRDGLPKQLSHTYDNGTSSVELFQALLENAEAMPLLSASDSRPECKPEDLYGFRATAGQFHLKGTLAQQHVVYEPQHCQLRRLTAASARRCLAGKYVVFVGDSLSRYQYLSLAYFLGHMKQLPRYHGRNMPHINNKQDFDSWQDFLASSSDYLVSSSVNATVKEMCDCSRPDGPVEENGRYIREYRRMCISTVKVGGGCRPGKRLEAGQLKLGYTQSLGYPSWWEAAEKSLRKVLGERRPPDVVIFNTGMWIDDKEAWLEPRHRLIKKEGEWVRPKDPATRAQFAYERIFRLAIRLSERSGARIIFKTTTARSVLSKRDSRLAKAARKAAKNQNIAVMDVWEMGKSALLQGFKGKHLFIDGNLHYYAYMYQEFNDVLLNMLCDSSCKWQQPPKHQPQSPRQPQLKTTSSGATPGTQGDSDDEEYDADNEEVGGGQWVDTAGGLDEGRANVDDLVRVRPDGSRYEGDDVMAAGGRDVSGGVDPAGSGGGASGTGGGTKVKASLLIRLWRRIAGT